ncbi:hypothetical protein HJFPF1_11420 [Paramyrothecium foliicola]|nr:hypothetical protein HJFPF1_11420 [Paramyrothecium foliicola]
MPADEYSSVGGGGALKLKGAKVTKKKKKSKAKADLEKNLAAAEDALIKRKGSPSRDRPDAADEDDPAKDGEEDRPTELTEAQKHFEEVKRQRLLKMVEKHPELLKSHRERVEDRNKYLSRLSEHHDMPKIGPG